MTADPAASYVHCDQQLRAEDHDAWLATLFAPVDRRPHLQALGAFALEVGHVRARARQAIAGEIRLQWWQDVVDGERGTEAMAHPVAAALVDTMARCALPSAPFGDMFDAQRLALYDEPPGDVATLERRLVALHGSPIRLAARILGGAGPAIDAAADEAGTAIGLSMLLTCLARPAEGRSALLPQDLLARDGARQTDADAGRRTPELDRVRADLAALALARLASLRGRRASLGDAAPAFLLTALVEPRLAGPGVEPAPWRRQWRIWRASRKGGVL